MAKKNKEEKRVRYYSDALNDDFAGTKIKETPFPEKLKYIHPKNFVWNFCSWFIYFVVAIPVLWIVGKIMYNIKVVGKKNLKAVKHKGVFIYGNHTQIGDAWLAQCHLTRSRRTYIFADKDAVSIKGIRTLVMMIGCLPIPDLAHKDQFIEAIKYHYNKKRVLVVYPEKHIWPYYTHIRNFPDDSFIYPATLGAPVVPICVTYRKRKIFKNKSPRMTCHVGKPIFPDMTYSLMERKKQLRDACYEFMIDKSSEEENVEYIQYIKKDE